MPDPLADLSAIEPIREDHFCEDFDCGKPPLNDWLQRFALQSHRGNAARTFLVHEKYAVRGYYSLSAGHVLKQGSPERLGAGMGMYPIPIILLARLACDRRYRGLGLGKALLKDAILRVIRISEDAGVRAIIVDAIDEEAAGFYRKAGFVQFPDDSGRLMMLMKDMKKSL